MALIEWDDRVVPFIAMWDGEMVGPDMLEGSDGVKPAPGTRYATREFGMWMISGPTRRTGKPHFAETHSRRQRRCMTEVRCQVCGEHRRHEMLWVIPNAGEHPRLWQESRWLINAPVCRDCFELATSLCPHLSSVEPLEVVQGRSRPVAVQGDLLHRGKRMVGAVAPLRHPITARMVGRELLVVIE